MILQAYKTALVMGAILMLSVGLSSNTQASGIAAYLDPNGKAVCVANEKATDPGSALNALTTPVVDPCTGLMLRSAIPSGTKVLSWCSVNSHDHEVIVDFSRSILGIGIDQNRFKQIYDQVRLTLQQYMPIDDLYLHVQGRPLLDFVTDRPASEKSTHQALAGHSTTLSPGHGYFWDGKVWSTQRPVYSAPLNEEDFHDLEMCQYLNTYLKTDGMIVKAVRCLDKNYGNHSSGNPWWKMGACYWLEHEGYPKDVYKRFGDKLQGTDSDLRDDICSRAFASDHDNTEIYLSVHTNGFNGDTHALTPSGTETYYDGTENHAQWAATSKDLATKVSTRIIDTLKANYDPTWSSHDAPVKDSNDHHSETVRPRRPAILVELAYHDTCDRDGAYLRDNFFRSASMWAIYKGVCDYFGVAPTWDLYSCEYVGDTIPTKMIAGRRYKVTITLRNHGVIWNEEKQIRLAALHSPAVFQTDRRQCLTSEISPGDLQTFTIELLAPSKPGRYSVGWQMVREHLTWFGPVITRNIIVAKPTTAHRRTLRRSRRHGRN